MLIFLHISKIFCIFVPMNQQVDIEKYLEEFRSEITRQKATIKDLTDNVARLNRRVEAQNVEIKSLKSENKDLRDRLTKYEDPQPPKNSDNSSVPPSKERMGDEIKRRTSSLREKSGKAVHWRNTNPEAIADTSTWIESLDKLLNENLDKLNLKSATIMNL